MNEAEVAQRYRDIGLRVSREADEPGKIYKPHAHQKTYLYCLQGSIKVRLNDGEWQELRTGQELIIGEGQFHEAVVGPNGWEYIHAQ